MSEGEVRIKIYSSSESVMTSVTWNRRFRHSSRLSGAASIVGIYAS